MLKSIPTLLFCLLLLVSCQNDDDTINTNSFIPNINFDTQNSINIELPQFNSLQFASNSLVLPEFGFKGIVIYNAGNNNYFAFEITDPNHIPSNCSDLDVDGIIATCNCDDGNSYNIVNGAPFDGTSGQFSLVPYFVEVNGSVIRVFNN